MQSTGRYYSHSGLHLTHIVILGEPFKVYFKEMKRTRPSPTAANSLYIIWLFAPPHKKAIHTQASVTRLQEPCLYTVKQNI